MTSVTPPPCAEAFAGLSEGPSFSLLAAPHSTQLSSTLSQPGLARMTDSVPPTRSSSTRPTPSTLFRVVLDSLGMLIDTCSLDETGDFKNESGTDHPFKEHFISCLGRVRLQVHQLLSGYVRNQRAAGAPTSPIAIDCSAGSFSMPVPRSHPSGARTRGGGGRRSKVLPSSRCRVALAPAPGLQVSTIDIPESAVPSPKGVELGM
eukprot:NODE_3072_length_985_cov_10.199786_g2255_i1.p1 GENE.NODE_3072_length_985_cov_10.199786_g2255_i1~~NODE_3072_length_985_cov_10.199786_g2255_i1.p1  ORF type:complete len:205 (-),score=21.51 NODE_3072_length_985_cov_10.199786_g2255_i1:77-691(-)